MRLPASATVQAVIKATFSQAWAGRSTHGMRCAESQAVPVHHVRATLPALQEPGNTAAWLGASLSCTWFPLVLSLHGALPACRAVSCCQVIMLLLGGFAIAAALSKHALAKRGATWILARVGGRPATVLLTNMLVRAAGIVMESVECKVYTVRLRLSLCCLHAGGQKKQTAISDKR